MSLLINSVFIRTHFIRTSNLRLGNPVDPGRKLNVHNKTFRRRLERLLNVS